MTKKEGSLSISYGTEYSSFSTPERALCAAILLRAVWDLYPSIGVERRDIKHAVNWFLTEKHPTYIFSFKNIKENLDLNEVQLDEINLKLIITIKALDESKSKREKGGALYSKVVEGEWFNSQKKPAIQRLRRRL